MELLRIAMDTKQIREACVQWAAARTNMPTPSFTVEGLPEKLDVVVVIGQRRVRTRKAKGAA